MTTRTTRATLGLISAAAAAALTSPAAAADPATTFVADDFLA